MNNQLKYAIRKFKLSYYNFRYSPSFPIVVPSVIVLLCVLMIIVFIVPQAQSWFSIQEEVKAVQEKIGTIKQNITYMQTINPQSIDNQLQATTRALPIEKDFSGILKSVAEAAITSQVQTDDYNFTIGALQPKKPTNNKVQGGVVTENGLIPITITLAVEGEMDNIATFISQLETRLPLAKVRHIEFSENKSQLTVSFYSRTLPDIKINDEVPVAVMTNNEQQLLQQLEEWSAK